MIGLAKFMKGSTTIGEMYNLPGPVIHSIYKLYIETMKDKQKAEAKAAEDAMGELEDAM